MTSAFDEGMRNTMRQLQEQLGQAEERRKAIGELTAEGVSEDGYVTVQVGMGGAVQGLTINPRAMRLDSLTLSETIMEAIAAGATAYAEAVRELTPNVPADPEKMLRDLGIGGQLNTVMEDFNRRMGDAQYNLDKLRRDLNT